MQKRPDKPDKTVAIALLLFMTIIVLIALILDAQINAKAIDYIKSKSDETPTKSQYSGFEYKVTAGLGKLSEPVKQSRYSLTDEEKRMLCFVADHEDYSSIESRQAIMQVVMNRIDSPKFTPDNVYDVLYSPKQFTVMKRYSDNYTPSDEALQALDNLLYGEDIFGGEQAIFFSASYVKASKIARNLYLVAQIGESKFWGQE